MLKKILVIIFFSGLTVLATYPLAGHFYSAVYGETNDALVTVWHYWWLNYAQERGLSPLSVSVTAAPYGNDQSNYPYYPVWNFTNTILSGLIGAVGTYNLQILLGFFLSGLFMFWFIFRLTGSVGAALVAGTIFALCPYRFAHAFEHLGLSNTQWVVLYIISLLSFSRAPSYLGAMFCGASFALVGFFDYYYLYFIGLFSVLFAAVYLIYYRDRFNEKVLAHFPKFLLLLASAGILLGPAVWHLSRIIGTGSGSGKSIDSGTFTRPFGQLFADSARILNYFLPSLYHPVLGKITKPFEGTFLYGENPPEQTLFLGWTALVLGYWGWKYWQGRSKLEPGYRNSPEHFTIIFFTLSFFVFMICSFPPYLSLGKIIFPFPSFFLYKKFSMFRNYARLGLFVMIAVCVLSGFGLKNYLEKLKTVKARNFTIGFLIVLVFIEFLSFPPYRMINAQDIPDAYVWIKSEPGDFVIAEYPIEADERQYLFYQRVHEKKLVNGAVAGTDAFIVRQKIVDLELATTSRILKFLGVKYVLLHKDRYQKYEGGGVLGKIPDLSQRPEYVLVRDFGDVAVYEINAEPIDPKEVTIISSPEVSPDMNASADILRLFVPRHTDLYQIKYLGIIPLGGLEIVFGEEILSGQKAVIPVRGRLIKNKILSWLVDADAEFVSLIDKQTNTAYEYQERFRVGEKKRHKTARFNQAENYLNVGDKKIEIKDNTQDPLSLIRFLGDQEFESGEKISVYMNPGKSNYLFEGEIVGKDKLKLNGVSSEAWKIEARIFKVKDAKKKVAEVSLWFADNPANTLLRLKADTKAGAVTMEIVPAKVQEKGI